MAYNEEEAKRSRVVVETPTARREVVETQAVRHPERSGISGTAIAALVVGTVALITIVVLLLMNQQQEMANANLAAQPSPAPQTTIIEQQPAQQPPVIVQQPAPVIQPPIIVNPPSSTSGGSTASNGPDDASIQAEIDKKFADEPTLSSLGIMATAINGKVTLIGTVKSEALKLQIERLVKAVKGVRQVDNQITVSG